MLSFKMPNDKDEEAVKIRFKSSLNNNYTIKNGNGMIKSNNGFDYHESLLNKKRKLENDLKNGNITNFNKVLNNAVLNSNRNNDNELIPNKIEFKLSHILKGEKKLTDNSTLNLADFNINNTMLDYDKNNFNKKNSDKLNISDNLNNNVSHDGNFEKKNSKINFNENDKNNSNLNIQKNSESDNTSDLTKTSSIEDSNKRFLNFNGENIIKTNIEISMEKKDTNYTRIDLLKSTSIRSQEDLNKFNDNKKESNEDRSISRKNSCLSNSSDKAKKSLKNQLFHDGFIDSLLEWKKPTHVGSGLNNMGNTCFLNSVLQSLLYTPGLVNYFLISEHKKKCNPRGICLMCEFHCLIESSKGIKAASLTPKNVLNNLKLISKNIKLGRQEDAHEFLLYLLDSLEKACKNFVTVSKNNFIVSSNINDDNLIQKLFGANLASCVICLRCKNVSKKIDRYLDISIDILNCDSIHRSFKNYCKSESLSGSNKFYCDNCKMKNDSLKKFSFENFPRVLIIHLKRFDNFQRKIKKFIEYPADLDLTNFSENKTEKYKYRLYAVLVHEGSTISWGHYYCYIKNSNDLWYCMNDSHVSQTSLKNVLSQTPYLLFYERVLEKKIDTNGVNLIRKNSVDNHPRKMSSEIAYNANVNLIRSSSNGDIKNSIQNNLILSKNNHNKSESLQRQNSMINSIEKPKDNKNDKENKDTDNKFDKLQKLNGEINFNITKSESEGKGKIFLNNENNINLVKKRSEEIKDNIMKDDTVKINKLEEVMSKNINEVIDKEKINEDHKKGIKSNLNILNIPDKNSLNVMNDKNKSNYKKSILDLKYKENEKYEDSKNIKTNKEESINFMGINEIKKVFFEKTENLPAFSNNKTNIKKNDEENFNLLKSKTSFEMKVDLCEKIDQKETSEIKNELAPLIISEINTRSRNIPLMSRKFKRLMSIYSKFSAINKNSHLNLLSKNSQENLFSKENIEKEIETYSKKITITELNLCDEQNQNFARDLNFDKKVENKQNIDKSIINNNEYEYKIANEINNTDNQETEAPAKKRIFNTKLNEMYNGRFIERWEDDEDDENELNKLRSQAEFVRKSEAFKKQKILKKSKYDMDYDAGKQKKVRIYEENDTKGKNVFQKMHTTIIKKIKKGIDPNKLISNSKFTRDAKRKEKKFKKQNFKFTKGKFDYKNNKFNNRIKNNNFNGWNKKKFNDGFKKNHSN